MRLLILLSITIALGACSTSLKTENSAATADQDPSAINVVDVCEEKSVYDIGVTDALTDKKMNAAFLATCEKSKRLDLRKSYKKGFKQGLAQKKQSNRSISGK